MKYFKDKIFNFFLIVLVALAVLASLDNKFFPAVVYWLLFGVLTYFIFKYEVPTANKASNPEKGKEPGLEKAINTDEKKRFFQARYLAEIACNIFLVLGIFAIFEQSFIFASIFLFLWAILPFAFIIFKYVVPKPTNKEIVNTLHEPVNMTRGRSIKKLRLEKRLSRKNALLHKKT